METKAELSTVQTAIHSDPDPELPETGIAQVWAAILAAIPDVEHWNLNLPRLVKENGDGFKRFAQLEAAKRGYLWSTQAKGYILPWSMHAVNGKNLIGVGYRAGRLAVIFASKDGPHRYESVADNVPREVAEKLWRVPYPHKLYAQIVKDKDAAGGGLMQMTLIRPYNNLRLKPLRTRQEKAIAEIRQAVKDGHKRIIVQAPCGFGKTVLAAHLIGGALSRGTRPLFTCPAISLVDQTVRSFESEGIRDIGVMQGDHERTDREAQVQVASVQTLIKRALPDVDFLVLDEIHRTYKGLNEMLDGPWANKIAIGLTATPWAKGMGLRWTKLIIPATIPDLIAESLLTPTTLYVPEQIANRDNIAVAKGEFTEKSSSEEMRQNRIVGNVVETWKKLGPGEKTFMFCVNLDHARAQMAAFIDSGIPFGYIDAQTSREDRTLAFKQMRHGEIAGIASVGCLIAGVDEDVRCVIDAAPTKSEMSLVQRWGRGIRTAEGKQALIGLDHAGNNTAAGLGLFWEIFHDHLDAHKPSDKGVAYEGEVKPAKPKKCAVCNALVPKGKAICTNCGEALHATGVAHEDGELVVYGTQPKEKKTTRQYSMQEKQDFYSGLIWLYSERGKPKPENIAAHRREVRSMAES